MREHGSRVLPPTGLVMGRGLPVQVVHGDLVGLRGGGGAGGDARLCLSDALGGEGVVGVEFEHVFELSDG